VAEQPSLSFAGLLRQLRAEAKLTQEELAEAAGLSPRSVSDLERGISRTARKDTALLLAGALGLVGSAGELFVAAARGKAPASEVLAVVRGAVPPPRGVITSPYRGLGVFEEQDAGLFFGREAATTEVVNRMARSAVSAPSVLVVSGVSGAGKSSLLRAGVLPQIRAGGLAAAAGAGSWPCLVFTPTRAPLDELALRVAVLAGADAAAIRRELAAHPEGFALTARQAALTPSQRPAVDPDDRAAGRDQPRRRRLLLVVDQFEELFTQCAEEGQRRAFITAVHAAATARHGADQAPAALAVLGVRSDFEARCADYPQLADAVQGRYLVTSMTERQLRMAITEPAKKAGAKVDDDLVGVLLAEMRSGQPGTTGAGALPLLSHALDQAWRCRTQATVTLADYERAGGIAGAVAASAQHAYDHLTPAQQAAARQVFTRLAATSTDGADSADRATRAELTEGKSAAAAQDVEEVLEAFAAERLLTLAANTVELSHEVLLTAWPLLRDTWLADTHADRIVRTRLHATAADWARHARDPSYLYTGTLLQAATDTAARIGANPARHLPLSQTERDFLHASSHAHRRAARRRQGFIALLMALVIGVASVAAFAFLARQDAVRQRDVAVSGQLISQSEALGDTDPVISKLESIAAWRIHPSAEARYAMLAAAARPGIAVLAGHSGPVYSMAFSPDGKTLASSGQDSLVRLWDVATGRQIGHPLPVPGSAVYSVAFSPDGTTLASGSLYGGVRLWDVATGHQIGHPLGGYAGEVGSAVFSPDGKTLASGSAEAHEVRLWDVATGRQIGHPFTGPGGPVFSVVFSPGGKALASSGQDGLVRVWDVATGHQIGHPLGGNAGEVDSAVFSPDGTTLASASAHEVRLWDVATGRQISHPLTGPSGPVFSVVFSPDGKALASSGQDGLVRLWDVATGRPIGVPFAGHTDFLTGLAFSPDGTTLASGSDDGTVRLWNVATGRPAKALLTGHAHSLTKVAFSPDGTTLASASAHEVRLWDVATGHQISHPLPGPGVFSAVFSPDGTTLASASAHGVRLWDVATGRHTGKPLVGHSSAVGAMAFSPDGTTLASATFDRTVQLWDVATGHQIREPLAGHGGATSAVASVAFSPDGKTLASSSQDGLVRLWDVATGHQIGEPLAGQDRLIVTVAFSPDGKTLATGTFDMVRLWHVPYLLEIVPQLCASAGRTLTRAEWARYVPPGPAYRNVCP
jgi:WD40 repeat protein/transcriptional regulator with XRE-family HTH domain